MNEIKGTDQGELIEGTADADRILTRDGADTVHAGAGDDQINGYLKTSSSWTYWSSLGVKQLYGEAGNDFIYGSSSNDLLDGGEGNDYVLGADGNDELRGGPGDDTLRGQAGDDSLDGGEGQDVLRGGDGNDVLRGGPGDDNVSGDAGDDTLDGGDGHDELSGDEGDDTYLIGNLYQHIDDSSGTDKAIVAVSFAKIPSSIEQVQYTQGALPLPYWIDALLSDSVNGKPTAQWLGPEKTYLYAFPNALPAYDTSSKDAKGWTPFTDTQQTRAQAALDYMASVLDLRFVPSSDANALRTLSFANNTQSGTTGYAFGPSDVPGGSDLFFDNSSATPNNARFADGTHAALTLMHEIGHALGLKHPFEAPDANGRVEEPPYLTGTENATAWSVMSYNSNRAQYQLQYSPLDVAALQYLYGPSPRARTGDDTYAVDSQAPNFIWDGAGTDTLSAAACTQGCTVFLTPGYWGHVGPAPADKITAAGQITVNFGSTLENLVGSPFDDALYGNAADNTIEGGAGHDRIDGGEGVDTAAYKQPYAQATIAKTSTGYTVQTSGDGLDTLKSIEFLRFSDQTIDLSQWPSMPATPTAAPDAGPTATSAAPTPTPDPVPVPVETSPPASPPGSAPTSGPASGATVVNTSNSVVDQTAPTSLPPTGAVPVAVPIAAPVPSAVPTAPALIGGEATLASPVVAGGALADQLQGGNGDDVLCGADGDDVLSGGPGNDVLQGGRFDAGQWAVAVDAQSLVHLRYNGSSAAPASLVSAQLSAPADQVMTAGPVPDARLLVATAPADRLTEIALLYHAAVGVMPEADWLQSTASSAASSDALVQLAADHWLEHTLVPNAMPERVRGLIEQVWGTASDAEVQEGVSYLQHGGSWAQGLAYLVAHPRASAHLRDSGGELVLTQPLNLGQIGWVRGSGDDTLYGGPGNDVLVGGDGRNLLDGGEGTDLVSLVGTLDDCTVQLKTTAPGVVDVVLLDHANGSENLLRHIEWVRLGDAVYRAKANMPALSEAQALPLADCVELVPAQTLTLMGLPVQA